MTARAAATANASRPASDAPTVSSQGAPRATTANTTRATAIARRGVTGAQNHPIGIEFEAQHILQGEQGGQAVARLFAGGRQRQGRLLQHRQVARHQAMRGKGNDRFARQEARAIRLQHVAARGGRAQNQVALRIRSQGARQAQEFIPGLRQWGNLVVEGRAVRRVGFQIGQRLP